MTSCDNPRLHSGLTNRRVNPSGVLVCVAKRAVSTRLAHSNVEPTEAHSMRYGTRGLARTICVSSDETKTCASSASRSASLSKPMLLSQLRERRQ